MTNVDRIRNMSDEELSEFLKQYANSPCAFCILCGISCKEQTLKWLQSKSDLN